MKKIIKIHAVLFDLDGTLLDTAPEFTDAVNTLRAEHRLLPVSLEHIRSSVSHGSKEVIKTAFNLSEQHSDFSLLQHRFLNLYQARLGNHTLFFPGILELLLKLDEHKIKWGIVTNKPDFLTQPLLEKLGLKNRAHCIVSGDTLTVSKPDPLPILYACEKIGVLPQNCYYVGDAERDILAGKASGMMATFLALYGYLSPKDTPNTWGADYAIQHPKEIWDHLSKLNMS